MDLNHIEELDDVSFGVEGLYTIESVYIQKKSGSNWEILT